MSPPPTNTIETIVLTPVAAACTTVAVVSGASSASAGGKLKTLPTDNRADSANPQQGTQPEQQQPGQIRLLNNNMHQDISQGLDKLSLNEGGASGGSKIVMATRATSPLTEESFSQGVGGASGMSGMSGSGSAPRGTLVSHGGLVGLGGHGVQHGGSVGADDDDSERKLINHVKIPATQHDNRKLFVGGLPTNVSEYEFLQFFEQFGEVIDSVVMIDRTTKRSRGFGFVTFASEEVARSLLTTVPGRSGTVTIMGKMCEVKASEPKAEGSSSHHHHHHNHHSHHNHHGNHRGGWNNDNRRSTTPMGGVGGVGGVGASGHTGHAGGAASPKQYHHHVNHHQNQTQKQFYSIDYDNRDFDELLYNRHGHMNYSMNDYGRSNLSATQVMYHSNVYSQGNAGGAATGLAGNTTGDAYASSAWETSYPGSHTATVGGDYGYVTQGVSEQGYSGYYASAGQYPMNSSMLYAHQHAMGGGMVGSTGGASYAAYSNYYAPSASAPMGMPNHGYPSDGSLESYPQQQQQQQQYPMSNYEADGYGESYSATSTGNYE